MATVSGAAGASRSGAAFSLRTSVRTSSLRTSDSALAVIFADGLYSAILASPLAFLLAFPLASYGLYPQFLVTTLVT